MGQCQLELAEFGASYLELAGRRIRGNRLSVTRECSRGEELSFRSLVDPIRSLGDLLVPVSLVL
jgi:hypothetical protein